MFLVKYPIQAAVRRKAATKDGTETKIKLKNQSADHIVRVLKNNLQFIVTLTDKTISKPGLF